MANDHTAGADHGTYKSYIIGFLLSVVLTVIPFYMVMNQTHSKTTIIVSIVALAVVQVLVHLYYFLHLNTSSEQRWNVTAFAYTVLLIFFVIGGSVWIMYHLSLNMMLH